MDQATFSELEHDSTKRRTRREEFLARMDELIPWERLQQRGRAPFYPKAGRGRYPLAPSLPTCTPLPGDEPWFRRRRCFASGRGPDPHHLVSNPSPSRARGVHGYEPERISVNGAGRVVGMRGSPIVGFLLVDVGCRRARRPSFSPEPRHGAITPRRPPCGQWDIEPIIRASAPTIDDRHHTARDSGDGRTRKSRPPDGAGLLRLKWSRHMAPRSDLRPRTNP